MLLGIICVKPRLVKQTTHLLFIVLFYCALFVFCLLLSCVMYLTTRQVSLWENKVNWTELLHSYDLNLHSTSLQGGLCDWHLLTVEALNTSPWCIRARWFRVYDLACYIAGRSYQEIGMLWSWRVIYMVSNNKNSDCGIWTSSTGNGKVVQSLPRKYPTPYLPPAAVWTIQEMQVRMGQ